LSDISDDQTTIAPVSDYRNLPDIHLTVFQDPLRINHDHAGHDYNLGNFKKFSFSNYIVSGLTAGADFEFL